MKIEKLKNGNVSARVYLGIKDGRRLYKRVTAETSKELRRLIHEEKLQFSLGSSSSHPDPVTVRQCYEVYLSENENVFSPSTLQGYRTCFRNSFQSLMDRNVFDITERDVQAEINGMASNLAFKTVLSRWSLFVCACASVRPEVKNWRPRLPQKEKPRLRVPSKEELETLIAYAEENSPEMVLPIMLGAFCGLRRGEIGALSYADIDFKKETVTISRSVVRVEGRNYVQKAPKSYAGFRSVPLSPRILKLIRERQKDGLELISVDIEQITDRFPHLLKNAGLPPFRFHDLRHYFASQLVLLGVPDIYAIRLTGHSTTTMLRNVYQHVFPEAEDLYRRKLLESL